jgi:hypothetical protein
LFSIQNATNLPLFKKIKNQHIVFLRPSSKQQLFLIILFDRFAKGIEKIHHFISLTIALVLNISSCSVYLTRKEVDTMSMFIILIEFAEANPDPNLTN